MIKSLLLFNLLLSPYVSIRKQEDLVQNVRRRLEEALTADMLAHIEDATEEEEEEEEGGEDEVSKTEKVEQVEKEEL